MELMYKLSHYGKIGVGIYTKKQAEELKKKMEKQGQDSIELIPIEVENVCN